MNSNLLSGILAINFLQINALDLDNSKPSWSLNLKESIDNSHTVLAQLASGTLEPYTEKEYLTSLVQTSQPCDSDYTSTCKESAGLLATDSCLYPYPQCTYYCGYDTPPLGYADFGYERCSYWIKLYMRKGLDSACSAGSSTY